MKPTSSLPSQPSVTYAQRPTPSDPCGPTSPNPISTQAWDDLKAAAGTMGSFLGASGPQILDGEGIISQPPMVGGSLGQPIGNTTTWLESGGGPGQSPWNNEVWDTTNPAALNQHFRFEHVGDLPPGFNGPIFLSQPPPPGTSRSHLRFRYTGPPTAADIAALPPAPAGATLLRFNVYNGPAGGTANAHTGRLMRVLGPNDEVMEFWSLWHDYQFPDVGDQDMWLGPDVDPITGTQTLPDYLMNIPDNAQFVFAHFTWQHF